MLLSRGKSLPKDLILIGMAEKHIIKDENNSIPDKNKCNFLAGIILNLMHRLHIALPM